MVKPITPQKAAKNKKSAVPDEVIKIFNYLITKNLSNGISVVSQEEVVTLIASNLGITKQRVYDRHLLDVEEVFEDAGWEVVYDKPGYNESYQPTFTFTEK